MKSNNLTKNEVPTTPRKKVDFLYIYPSYAMDLDMVACTLVLAERELVRG